MLKGINSNTAKNKMLEEAMSTRIEEWISTENTVVKSYEQLQEENANTTSTREYNEKIIEPWTEQNRMENELRKKLGAPPDWASDKEKIEFHRRQLALLEKAKLAPRCGHIFSDGRQCRSPRVRKGKHCYAHIQMLARKPQRMNLPPLEDANAVALWLMEVSRGLLDGQISERTAGLLFYGLQLAMVNARWTTFTETNPEEMVRVLPDRRNRRDRASSPESEAKESFIEEATEDEGHLAGEGALRQAEGRLCGPRNMTEVGPTRELVLETQPGAAVPDEHGIHGHPPQHAKTARVGDPGDGSRKSFVFGEEEGGRGIR
jgi:hypothetical protein